VLVVDTNVLVYAADGDSPFHASCRAWLGVNDNVRMPGIPHGESGTSFCS